MRHDCKVFGFIYKGYLVNSKSRRKYSMSNLKAFTITLLALTMFGCAKTAKVSSSETSTLAYKQFVYAEENSDHTLNNIRYLDFDQADSTSKSVILNVTSVHNAGSGNIFYTYQTGTLTNGDYRYCNTNHLCHDTCVDMVGSVNRYNANNCEIAKHMQITIESAGQNYNIFDGTSQKTYFDYYRFPYDPTFDVRFSSALVFDQTSTIVPSF